MTSIELTTTLIGQRGLFGPISRLLQGQSGDSGAPSAWIILAVPVAIVVLWVLARRKLGGR